MFFIKYTRVILKKKNNLKAKEIEKTLDINIAAYTEIKFRFSSWSRGQ